MNTVVITGISRGIGRATAEKFLDKGWQVIGASRSGNIPFEHEHLFARQADMTDDNSVGQFIEFISAKVNEIDVLINNAAILIDKNQQLPVDVLRKTLEVNVFGLINLTENLISMVRPGGHIINLSSGLGSIQGNVNGYYPAYRISKVSVNMYTRMLASRLAEKGIRVSSIDPGWVKTDMGGAGATRNPSEPAQEIYELATSENDSGYFWYKEKKQSW